MRTATRREFLATCSIAAGAMALGAKSGRAADPVTDVRFPIIGFSKPFQSFTAEQTADLVSKVGWDGIECPIRAKGQIEPERVPDELPGFVDVLRQRKLEVMIAATNIVSMKTPHAETVLRTLAKVGIRRVRLAHILYPPDQPPADRLKEITPGLRDVAAACKDLGLQAGIQNHSGHQYVAAAVWDVFPIIRDLDPKVMGYCFDIGHATVEGGLSWPTDARLAEPFLTAVMVKDFYWKKEAGGWKDTWCPLGEGMVNRGFFTWLKKTQYRGPICQHHEYFLGNHDERLTHFQQDLKVLKEWLA